MIAVRVPDRRFRRSQFWRCVACALLLAPLGCKSPRVAPGVPTAYEGHGGPWSWLKQKASDHDWLADQNAPRAGSALAQPARPATTTAVDPRAMNDVIAQLQAIGTVDPAVQAKLMTDLRRTDPSLWPLVMETYRSTVAFQNRAAGGSTPTGALTTAPAANGTLPPEVTDGRSSTPSAAAAAPQLAQQKAPWNALEVPAATAADQVVLKNPSQQPVAVAAAPTSATAPASPAAVATTSAAPSTAATSPAPPPAATPPAATTAAAATLAAAPAAGTEPPPLAATSATPLAQAPAATPPVENEVRPAVFTSIANDPSAGPALSSAIAALESRPPATTTDAGDVSRQAILRMMYLAAGRRDDALRPIVGASPSEQEYWNKQLASLATLLDVQAIPDPRERAAAAHQRLSEANGRLAELSPLLVQNMAFCSEVASYGVITRFKETEFVPGQQVLLYAEIENFQSEHTPQGYRTSLKSSYQVLDKDGKQVATAEPQTMEEICNNARRDYFVRYRLTLPKPLADGIYTLQLSIEDTLAKKTGKGSIDLTIKDKK